MSPSKHTKKNTKTSESRKRLASLLSQVKNIDELWIALIALAVVGVIAVGVFLSSVPEPVTEMVDEIITDKVHRHPLTGEVVDEAYEDLPQVFGVMVENAADAWPLSGIDQAFLVIEAPVEAGIPRFIAFFSDEDEVEKIGPVRSARPYYIDWNGMFNAIYAHVGGAPAALEQIADGDILDLNQFWFAEYFWRENGTRYAPHNVYTSTDDLIDAMEEFDLEEPSYDWWMFDEIEGAPDPVQLVDIDFADGTLYDPSWTYNTTHNAYLRDQSGYAWLEDGAEAWADNVIVMAMNIRTIDNVGRKSIETFSQGDALVFRMGYAALVSWSMQEGGRIVLTDSDGNEIAMQPGTTWIEIVEDLSQVDYE